MFRKMILAVITMISTMALAAIPVEEIDFKKALFGSEKSLVINDSRGPDWGDDLIQAMLEQWESDVDFNNLFDDGMNHDAIEQCEPEVSGEYQVDDAEINEWPTLGGDFYSIKRVISGRSIAYLVAPWAEYTVEYTIVDESYEQVEVREVKCKVMYGESYIYKNTKDKSIQFLQKVVF